MKLIGLAIGLLIVGFALVLLSAVRVIDPSLPLLLLAYGGSLAGLCVGYVGIAQSQPFE
jgi:hypothetical protein